MGLQEIEVLRLLDVFGGGRPANPKAETASGVAATGIE
jgi:hypothetical protein